MPKPRMRDGAFQRKDRSGWYISYTDAAGCRRKEKVAAHTRAQALSLLAAIKVKIAKEQVLGVKYTSEITVADLFSRFRRYQKVRLSPSTFARLDGILKILSGELPARVQQITRQIIADLINTRAEQVAPGTVAKEMVTLKHALRLAVEWELLHENPANGMKLPSIPEGRTRYLSPAELKAALAEAPDWMRPILALAAFTGMRRGELLALRWIDIDLENRRAYLHDTKYGTLGIVALNKLALRVLESLPASSPEQLVFANVDAQKLSVYTQRLFRRLGIHKASFHSLRHTTASWLVMQGVDLYVVGQILRHKSPRMTQRYAHLSPQYVAAKLETLDSVFGGVLPGESAADGLR
jgi:integrase